MFVFSLLTLYGNDDIVLKKQSANLTFKSIRKGVKG